MPQTDKQRNPIQLDPATTSLVLIDLQRGVIARPSAGPRSAQDVVTTSAALVKRFRSAGAMIVFVHVNLSNFRQVIADQPSRDPNAPPPPPEASEILSQELGQHPDDLVIAKRFWDAFGCTELEEELRAEHIKTIVLAGIATNFGVESTARTAAALGFDVVLAEDAMTSVTAEAHRFAVETIFPRLGRVRSSEEILVS